MIEQSMQWYDTVDGLTERIQAKGLSALESISSARLDAVERGEDLSEWCLFGRLVLRGAGFMFIYDGAPADGYAFLGKSLPIVAPMEEVYLAVQFCSMTCPRSIPNNDSACDRCGRGWTPKDLKDYAFDIERPRHRRCHELYLAHVATGEFEEIVERSRIPATEIYAIQNEYDQSRAPWFIVKIGGLWIKMGWRKRVIHIEWPVKVPDSVFEFEDVTKSDRFIHAWSRGKATEYLERFWFWMNAVKP